MSLITLTSRENEQNPNSSDPAVLRNHYKHGIKMRKGMEVALISLTFNKISMIEIIAGVNDTLSWRIGARTDYLVHKVTIPAGQYTGASLARQMKTSLDESTILGNFKGGWTVTFTAEDFDNKGSFAISYTQNEVPSVAGVEMAIYDGTLGSITNNTDSSIILGAPGTTDDLTKATSVIVTGKKSVFPNDGDVRLRFEAIDSVSEFSIETVFQLGDTTNLMKRVDQSGPTTTPFSMVAYGGANGWDYQIQDGAGPTVYEYWKINVDGLGVISRGSTDADATNPVNRDLSPIYWNDSSGTWRDADAGGTGTIVTSTGFYFGLNSGTAMTLTLSKVAYGTQICGLVRNSLYNGRTDYPGNPNALITSTEPTGFDYMFKVTDNGAADNIAVSLSQMLLDKTKVFPNAGWNGDSRAVFTDLEPDVWNASGLGTTPNNWTTYTYLDDAIQLRIKAVKNRTMEFYISHDTAGNGVFTEEVLLARTGTANTGVGMNDIPFNTKEWFYPYRPCMALNNGGTYSASEYVVDGIFDAVEATNTYYTQTGLNLDFNADEAGGAEDVGLVAPTNAVTLSALFILGEIVSTDIGSGAGQIPAGDVPTDRRENNIFDTIGTPRFEVFASGSPSNQVSSITGATDVVREPNIMVELQDFNIEGHNADTSDRAKLIAVIPSEELNTNTRSGTLNYYAHFPIFIDLNLEHDRIVYDLNAILRTPDGRVVEDLINPTSMTLLLKESEETRQERIAQLTADNIASAMSGLQQNKLDKIGVYMPRV